MSINAKDKSQRKKKHNMCNVLNVLMQMPLSEFMKLMLAHSATSGFCHLTLLTETLTQRWPISHEAEVPGIL